MGIIFAARPWGLRGLSVSAVDLIGFGPEDIANLIIGFESALAKLGLTDRSDLATTQVANLRRTASAIIQWA
jgi:hypothetical protein